MTATSETVSGNASVGVVLLPGDINGDGQRTSADVAALITALTDLDHYQSMYHLNPADFITAVDVDGDTFITNADIQALICLIANTGGNGGTAACIRR